MGTVYAAFDSNLERVVALKVLHPATSGHDDALQTRMWREARLGARAQHDRIAMVIDAGTHDGRAFVAMEYVSGGTLRRWMADRRPSAPEIVDIATQIAEGLAELHGKGVIHRDLKPENVMLTEQGGIKLLDFGLARHALAAPDEPAARPRIPTYRGASVAASGTPGYMAPEQRAGGPIDARVDIFSLGVILHELVTGERLFRGDAGDAASFAPPALDGPAWQAAPARLREYTTRMLSREPDDRFAGGGEVLAALRELTGDVMQYRGQLPQAIIPAAGSGDARRRWRPIAKRVAPLPLVAAVALAIYLVRLPSTAALPPPPPGMVLIYVGTIEVGRNAAEIARECDEIGSGCVRDAMEREIPRTKITVAPFFIDRFEVTNEQYAELLKESANNIIVDNDDEIPYPRYVHLKGDPHVLIDLHQTRGGIIHDDHGHYQVKPGQEKLPISQVSWYGAKWFCESRGKRLPTENEWETAARGGGDRRFPWGNDLPRCGDVVIPNDGKLTWAGPCPAGLGAARAVGTAPQDVTPEGVHDLAGNVSEWTNSAFALGDRAQVAAVTTNEPPRITRGGSWGSSMRARTSGRSYSPSIDMARNLGFRCAADARQVSEPTSRGTP
jgi:serine/threonine protein kinase